MIEFTDSDIHQMLVNNDSRLNQVLNATGPIHPAHFGDDRGRILEAIQKAYFKYKLKRA